MAGILSVGAAGLDTLTVLDTYPIEDAKVRSKLQVKDGGGNAANTASAISKLGVKSFLISMVGNDIESDKIIGRLNEYAVDTSLTVRTSDSSSGTTFIIVCANTCSRTCIHNPMHSELQLSDIRDMNLDLKPFSLVHFDSRHTLASVEVARMAQQCNKLVTIDIEKMRPHVANLLPFCEIMFTNSVFPTTLLEAG